MHNPEMPSVKIGKVADFFDHLCRKTKGGSTLPTWRGELYFELHRGVSALPGMANAKTYTSQEGLKSGNRKMEKLLRDLEYFATLASLRDSGYMYPKTELDEIWKDVLLNQFHDVLPGTSIRMAIDDALEIYERRIAQTEQLIEAALESLLPRSSAADGISPTASVLVIDPLRLPRKEIVVVDQPVAPHLQVPTQTMSDGRALALLESNASGTGAFVTPKRVQSPKAERFEDAFVLSNAHFRLTIVNGRITSLVDVPLERELILPGPRADDAGLMLYEDLPLAYDAWDTEIYHLDCGRALHFDKVEVADEGPLRASLRAESSFGQSRVILTVSQECFQADVRSRSTRCSRMLQRPRAR
jgi:alpha-mannosidase